MDDASENHSWILKTYNPLLISFGNNLLMNLWMLIHFGGFYFPYYSPNQVFDLNHSL